MTLNLHHVWDTTIPETMVGGIGRQPYPGAKKWADELTTEITSGKFQAESSAWLKGIALDDPTDTALIWAREGNAFVCSTGKTQKG